VKKEEDVLTYILYPAIAPAFLKGEKKAEAIPQKQPILPPQTDVPPVMEVEVDGEVFTVRIVSVGGSNVEVASVTPQKAPRGDVEGGIKSNMQGMVLKVNVSRGSAVKKGEALIVLEAMKMENPIHNPIDGKVTEIFVDTGDVVQTGDVLLVVQ
jgi:pyruvate carboxylase subunit B